ncbi:hypothetical protein I603_0143 [Erythrobacter dokdonensis DSW-74]|uniref:Uncharacterized protein n=1 Tax=Erythrobacter dokdonensis DSW-74 TaxID=1300349 RepID=A0A1A7BKK3_9SPHN|nr:hypothetical protein I603_0143 [Erythrobacter dokdonensis DSW-74]
MRAGTAGQGRTHGSSSPQIPRTPAPVSGTHPAIRSLPWSSMV